mmetsp:Transcript_10693/g.14990  ORF Transcript_10693/g.14990 Transcript_10693/m.14990 type:complete len:402 (+) Transcript_10693:163-1368(+)
MAPPDNENSPLIPDSWISEGHRLAMHQRRANTTYATCWKTFKTFVDAERRQTEQEGPYLTRQNVDLFFSSFVLHLDCTPESAKMYVYALRWYANEIPGGFEVDSVRVRESLKSHARKFSAANLPDVRASLPTNMLCEHDKLTFRDRSEGWATSSEKRAEWTTVTDKNRAGNHLANLSEANSQAYGLIMNEISSLRNHVTKLFNEHAVYNAETRRLLNEALIHSRRRGPARQNGAIVMTENENNEDEIVPPVIPIAPNVGIGNNVPRADVRPSTLLMARNRNPVNAFHLLTSRATVPDLPRQLGKTLTAVFDHFINNHLDKFINSKKSGWSNKQRVAFSKRHFVYKTVLKKNKENPDNSVSLQSTVASLDEDREIEEQTVAQWIEENRKHDNAYKSRSKQNN